MPGVFISYRREDSGGYTGRLFDILSTEFGRENTYMDLDTIEGGDDFASVINQKISVSDVLVAVIGDRWLAEKAPDGTRRLDNPHDFVRIEIAEALRREIRVIPVLVAGAAMPLEHDLPDDLRPLCGRQAVEIRDSHFHQDAQQLTEVLKSTLHGIGFRPDKSNVKRIVLALLFGVAAIAGAGILLFHERRPAPPPISNSAHQQTIPPTAGPVPALDAARAGADLRQKAPQPPSDIAGKWSATVIYDWGDTYKETFDFEVDGQELSGTAGLLGEGRTIREGKITGNRISFMTRTLTMLGSDRYEDTHSYKGIVAGGAIRFTMVTDSRASEHTPVHFIATKVKDK
jgi:hypothetical protein